MKYKIIMLLVILLVTQNIVGAVVNVSDTEPYHENYGKIIVAYSNHGDNIIEIAYQLWDIDSNVSTTFYEATNAFSPALTSLVIQIEPETLLNHTNVRYEINVKSSVNGWNRFAGFFSTEDKTTNIDYSKINQSNTQLFEDMQQFLLGNASYVGLYTSVENSVVSRVVSDLDGKISSYNEGMVAQLKAIGLTDEQVHDVMTAIDDGFTDTLRTTTEQTKAEISARDAGFWYGVQLCMFFIVVGCIVVAYLLFRNNFVQSSNVLNFRRKGKSAKTSSDTIDFDFE